MSTRATKPTIFFERWLYKVEGMNRSYPRLRISVFETFDLESTSFARVNFTWMFMDDGSLVDQPRIEIDDRLGAAKKAMSLAMRISSRWHPHQYHLTPSELQGVLAQMRARKVFRPHVAGSPLTEVSPDQYRPF